MRVFIAAVLATISVGATHSTEVRTHIVQLDRNRFAPATIRARVGDSVRFVNGQGGPHNVEFDKDSIAPALRPLIEAGMGKDKIGPMSSTLLILTDEIWTFVVPALPAGRYAFLCTPHWGNMRGALIVDR